MKILNINSYYFSSSVHKQLQSALHKQGIESETYVPLTMNYVPREECQYGIEDDVQISECYGKFDRYIFHIKHYKILRDIKQCINLEDFDCLHAHSLFSNGFIAMKIKEKFGVPYVVAVRDTDLNIFFKYMVHLRRLGLKILQEADKIIFLSEPYKDFLNQKYIPRKLRKELLAKSEIISNGIDHFWLTNKGCTKYLENNKALKLIYVGGISKRKNIGMTVKAVETLRNKGYEIIFTIIGKIVDKFIFDQIKDLPFINYIQPVTKEELIQIYRDNDIFIMPSITETFGLVYAEAMSQGLPVVYTRGQGFDGQFEEGEVGYSVDCFDADDIANKVVDIINSYDNQSNKCIKLCNKFDWDNIIQTYIEIYHNIEKMNNGYDK
ncbi:glycosyltransferase family 4 protein [Acetobacterium sp.]|uniref:glycosyltransferase family 4 protein n=1 Tax=Acetobacterium sp. TaxID=1872094 RepID=UPI002F42D8B4